MFLNRQYLSLCAIFLAIVGVGCSTSDNHSFLTTPTVYLSLTPEILETMTPEILISTQTPELAKIPTPVSASEDEIINARKILQEYYSALPYLNETTSAVYHEYHGCVGTNDVFGVLSYDTVYSFEAVKDALKSYFQTANWEYTEKDYSETTQGSRYKANRISKDIKPVIETMTLRIYKWPANPEQNEFVTKLEIYIEYIENRERYLNRETQYFYSICESDWWLWIGP